MDTSPFQYANRNEYPLFYLFAAIKAAGGSVTVTREEILAMGKYIVHFRNEPTGDITMTLVELGSPVHGPTRPPRTSER